MPRLNVDARTWTVHARRAATTAGSARGTVETTRLELVWPIVSAAPTTLRGSIRRNRRLLREHSSRRWSPSRCNSCNRATGFVAHVTPRFAQAQRDPAVAPLAGRLLCARDVIRRGGDPEKAMEMETGRWTVAGQDTATSLDGLSPCSSSVRNNLSV